MQSQVVEQGGGERTFVLVLETGDEAMAELERFAREQGLSAAHFTGIGAFSDAVLGYFDWQQKDYRRIPVQEQVEVVALVGDVALEDDAPSVHAHVVVARSDGSASGGHLLAGHVRPTLEIVLSESPSQLRKRYDPASGLALIALDEVARTMQGEANLPPVPSSEATVAGRQAQRVVEQEAETPRSATEEGG